MPLSDMHRKAINFYIRGHSKKDSCVAAGFSKNSVPDIFNKPEVREEIERRMKLSEKTTDMDRAWLLNKLKIIIEAEPGQMLEVDADGRPSLNFKNLTSGLKKAISKVTLDATREGGKYKRTKMTFKIDVPDRINAIKEAAILLGIRETKTQINVEQELIDKLTKRRQELTGENGDE